MMTRASSAVADSVALPAPPQPDLATAAFFVDIDGTLLDLAPRPDAVVVDPVLPVALAALRNAVGDALAPVSGRPISEIDSLLGLSEAAAAGLHGAELRGPGGASLAKPIAPGALADARKRAIEAGAEIPGTLIEDKGGAIALHYRAVPEAEMDVRHVAAELLKLAGDDYEILHGKFVVELKPRNADKGTALDALMHIAPFAGRVPWMLGDDITDEFAFEKTNALGGISIIVGARRPTLARYALPNPAATRAWLGALAGHPIPAPRTTDAR